MESLEYQNREVHARAAAQQDRTNEATMMAMGALARSAVAGRFEGGRGHRGGRRDGAHEEYAQGRLGRHGDDYLQDVPYYAQRAPRGGAFYDEDPYYGECAPRVDDRARQPPLELMPPPQSYSRGRKRGRHHRDRRARDRDRDRGRSRRRDSDHSDFEDDYCYEEEPRRRHPYPALAGPRPSSSRASHQRNNSRGSSDSESYEGRQERRHRRRHHDSNDFLIPRGARRHDD